MKVADMNARQKKAFYNIKHAANWLLGGLENTMLDNAPETEEHKRAAALLNDHDRLVKQLYEMATTEIYGDGWCCFDPTAVQLQIRDINFCGKEFLMERCERRITKEGY